MDPLEALGEDIAELDDALGVVLAADAAARGERTTLEALGLGREDFFAELTGARDAISAGDPAAADDLAGQVQSALAVAESVGRQRADEVADTAVSGPSVVAAARGRRPPGGRRAHAARPPPPATAGLRRRRGARRCGRRCARRR